MDVTDTFLGISDALSRIRWQPPSPNSDQPNKQTAPEKVDLGSLSKEWWRFGFSKEAKEAERKCHGLVCSQFKTLIQSDWPVADKLEEVVDKWDSGGRSVGAHVVAVIASVNALLSEFEPDGFFRASEAREFNKETRRLAESAYEECWGGDQIDQHRHPPFFGSVSAQHEFARGFLRIAALYHDLGKIISDDHHVTRGVHLMRDVSERDRRAIEGLFTNLWDRRCFLSLLRHHDVYGCLCTGEASLPALADMVGWTSPVESDLASGRSTLAQISFLNWLNIADSNASLIQYLGGITAVEGFRYLSDWRLLKDFLLEHVDDSNPTKRDDFKNWALEAAARPDKTILRISRLVASCFRKETGSIDHQKELMIQELVAEELQALHGPRFERFCFRFAHFCKLDYALRFFYELMNDTLLDEGLTSDKRPGLSRTETYAQQIQDALKNMISRTCAILDRIVEEYGHLVDGDQRAAPRLGVDMSKLMTPRETGQAICSSLKKSPAGALWWIIDEIGIWLYGD